MHPLAAPSRQSLRATRNRYEGQKAVILCNGPSLNRVDFDALLKSGVFTFGMNKINLLFSKSDFRPSCVVAVNEHVIEQNAAFFKETAIPVYLNAKGVSVTGRAKQITYLHMNNRMRYFAGDCSMSVYSGSTVTYVAMQLAYHMGFDRVALVGCDHNFSGQANPNETLVSGQTDPNHFHPDYFAGGNLWQYPDLVASEFSYKMADEYYRQHGRKLYNATEGGKLELLERIDLNSFLAL